MCGRYSQTLPHETVRRVFDIHDGIPLVPRFNIAPGQDVPVIRLGDDRQRHLAPMRWGFIAKGSKPGDKRPINAMREHLHYRMWADALANRRCLLPADSFYEWNKDTKPRQPWRFMRSDGEPYGLLGIYESWQPPQGGLIESVAVITVPANELVAKLHNRMPAMLDPEQVSTWLDPNAGPLDVQPMLAPYSNDKMRSYTVSPRMNAATFEDARCVEPWREEARLL